MKVKALVSVLVLYMIAAASVSAGDNAGVELTVTVVSPQYDTYVGAGLLSIEDQNAHGKANLHVPRDTAYPIILDIMRGRQIVASWEWAITSHESSTIKRRRYDVIIDTYVCVDGEGRGLLVRTITCSEDRMIPRASAIGIGAFFLGKLAPP